ncbi:hypothetical protein ACH5RR_017671 [Cinchona calisaya]|uniref:Uncharacterized protein n=1 Tax=Cinchona calisaya TaxID=153742 RepID=A0ABD2ZJ87_9GENT
MKLVDKCSVQRLIKGCPSLEELFLVFTCSKDEHGGTEVVDFSSASVKKPILSFWEGECAIVVQSNNLESLDYQVRNLYREHDVTINAPNLKYMTYHAPAAGAKFIRTLNSLIEANLALGWLYPPRSEDIIEHLNTMPGVKSLCLEQHILETLYVSGHLLPTFKYLTSLELHASRWDEIVHVPCWKTLFCLLENAPNLEALAFHGVGWDFIGENNEFESYFQEVFPACFLEHLKEI